MFTSGGRTAEQLGQRRRRRLVVISSLNGEGSRDEREGGRTALSLHYPSHSLSTVETTETVETTGNGGYSGHPECRLSSLAGTGIIVERVLLVFFFLHIPRIYRIPHTDNLRITITRDLSFISGPSTLPSRIPKLYHPSRTHTQTCRKRSLQPPPSCTCSKRVCKLYTTTPPLGAFHIPSSSSSESLIPTLNSSSSSTIPSPPPLSYRFIASGDFINISEPKLEPTRAKFELILSAGEPSVLLRRLLREAKAGTVLQTVLDRYTDKLLALGVDEQTEGACGGRRFGGPSSASELREVYDSRFRSKFHTLQRSAWPSGISS
ncbi:hypothetical protein C8J55DRAFT_567032 [Lentinula edodes]|uniref:Uncharacterized protein n=1 Tax=Lentinula lateritia TaxID=40482 RepID=A0A9W8ZQP9_9AGAR|nr:hypothetical protein C8J55DRAFT_567032 [Lentinula edodes]